MAALGDILWFAALGALVYYMMSKGGGCCGGHNHKDHGKEHKGNNPENEHAVHHRSLTANNAPGSPAAQDPVCGMSVKKDATAPASEHFGRTFHFCSERCRKLFDINPGKYAGPT
jgi:Cu+-exporting ATPase